MSGTALIYIRQSRNKDYERTASPEVQEQACRELDAVKACQQVIVFTDLDVSGGKTKRRQQWLALRDRLETSTKDDGIVLALYDQSRAFRNTADALELYVLLESKPWIDVAFVHGRFDRSPAGEFTYTAMAAAHAMERRMTAEKIRAAKNFRSAQGEAVGPLPAGYKWVIDGKNKTVEIDEEVAPIVRRLFEEYATGRYGSRVLAHRLNAEGAILPANTGAKELRGLGRYGDTVMQVLSNIAYTGRTYAISRRHRTGAIIDAQWPALIEPELWNAVQRQRELNRRTRRTDPATIAKRNYVFQGLLRCKCGRFLTVQTMKGHAYYRCRGGDAPDRCTAKGVKEAAVLPWARTVMERLEAAAPDAARDRAMSLSKEQSAAPSALKSVEDSLARTDFMYLSAKRLTEEQYLAEVERLTQIRTELLNVFEPQAAPLDFTGVLGAWDSGDPLVRRQLLGEVFDAIDIEDGMVVAYLPRADRSAEVSLLLEGLASAEREGFEPSIRVDPVYRISSAAPSTN